MSDLPIEAIVACDAEVERLRARVAELEADNADFKKLIADELAETFRLFGAIGLNEADDFGTKTAIEAVRDRIESIKADRDRWKAKATVYIEECETWRRKIGASVHVGVQGRRCRLCERLGPDDQRQWHNDGCWIVKTDAARAANERGEG